MHRWPLRSSAESSATFAVDHSHIEIKIEVYDKNWIYQSRLPQEPRRQRGNDGAAQAKGL